VLLQHGFQWMGGKIVEKFIIGKICSLYLFFVACMNAYNGKDKVKKRYARNCFVIFVNSL